MNSLSAAADVAAPVLLERRGAVAFLTLKPASTVQRAVRADAGLPCMARLENARRRSHDAALVRTVRCRQKRFCAGHDPEAMKANPSLEYYQRPVR